MNHHNPPLTAISGICAVVSITDIQPVLTFIASLIAIFSGLYSIYKKSKK
jgi:hypothetical protein